MTAGLSVLSARSRYLIGISGGRDSVALLHLLLDRGIRRLTLCHLNHGLRGRSSAADAHFIEKLGAQHDLSVVIGNADVKRLAVEERLSLETAARVARYRFFAATARLARCRKLLLGHHADDQVETFLFNLFRGSGTAGLAAMRPVSDRTVDRFRLTIHRPMLGVWREEIDAYMKKRNLKFREDHTNTELRHTRNRMRHQVIPALEKEFGREIRKSVWRASELLGAEEDWLATLIPTPEEKLSVAALRGMPVAQQRRTIHGWLKARTIPGVGYSEVELIRRLLDDPRIAKVNLPGNRHARRRSGAIFVE